ncbi:hypothetical protein K474DRAFT_1641090 [Panus rudis PR-1116 ss-1]|nr:hypothetical protein K474DRAFT_1641090 [Panus rudis PR-1116 ss-1]
MQAVLDASGLKQVIKALTCLTKYGDDLMLLASPDRLLMHTTNSSQTAYARFIYHSGFFQRYRVDCDPPPASQGEYFGVDGLLSTKSLLAVLKPKTVEKTVTRCEMSIVHGAAHAEDENDDEHDSLESKLIVRLHCKHGVVKTHRLLLSDGVQHMAPNIPESLEQSHICIGPRSLKDILEHFSVAKYGKNDAQLIWTFGHEDVVVRSHEGALSTKGGYQLATELSVAADEFTLYDVYSTPITIAFHLREFFAVIQLAEAANLTLALRFTEPGEPLFIEAEGGDHYETLFIISMSQLSNAYNDRNSSRAPSNAPQSRPQVQQQKLKRPREDDTDSNREQSVETAGTASRAGSVLPNRVPPKKPMKAAVVSNRASVARETASPAPRNSMPPPSLPASAMGAPRQPTPGPSHSQQQHSSGGSVEQGRGVIKQEPLFYPGSQASQQQQLYDSGLFSQPAQDREMPLFLPSSQALSQLSKADEEAIIQSGLGIEYMNMDEFNAMLDGEGEEVGFNAREDTGMREQSLEYADGTQIGPTQDRRDTGFKPLFDD